jgi:hypothetical protein
MDEAKEIIIQQVRTLTPELKRYFTESSWRGRIEAIAANFGLDGEQTAGVEMETTLVLIALEDIANLPSNIQTNVRLPQNDAVRIAQSIENAVIGPVKDSLLPFQGHDTNSTTIMKVQEPISEHVQTPQGTELQSPVQIAAQPAGTQPDNLIKPASDGGLSFLDSKLENSVDLSEISPVHETLPGNGMPSAPISKPQTAPNSSTTREPAPPPPQPKIYPGGNDPYREQI